MRMDYLTFKNCLLEKVRDEYENKIVGLHKVTKSNLGEIDSLTIMESEDSNTNVSPNFYVQKLYLAYEEGKDFEEIVQSIIDQYNHFSGSDNKHFDASFLGDYESVRDRLYFRTINAKKNEKYLQDKIYKEYLDMALVMYMKVVDEKDSIGSICITKDMLANWDVTEDELIQEAMENAEKVFPAKITSLASMVESLLEEEFGDGIAIRDWSSSIKNGEPVVVTNTKGLNGFSSVAYDDVLKSMAAVSDSDLYILPSSIHEAIVFPVLDDSMDADSLAEMVREVNGSAVSEEEFLSNSVYLYRKEEQRLVIATKGVEEDV